MEILKEKEFSFLDTCQTVCLKKSDVFLSSFPGKIVFGEPSSTGFSKLRSFQFKHHEFFNLYLALVQIVQFFANNENTEEKGPILIQDEKIVYFWCGKNVLQGNDVKKIVKFGIECDFNIVFEVILDSEQFNELVSVFSKLMFSCLCLKSFEKEFLENLTNELTITNLVELQAKENQKSILKKTKLNKIVNSINEQNLLDLVLYYNEFLILFKKIKSLIYSDILELNRIEAILNH
jgi:hypothetical protein